MSRIEIPQSKASRVPLSVTLAALFATFAIGFAGAKLTTPQFSAPMPDAGTAVELPSNPGVGLDPSQMPPLDLSGGVIETSDGSITLQTQMGVKVKISGLKSEGLVEGDQVQIELVQ